MKSHSLDIPDAQDELAGWLAGYLLSRNLAALVAELAAVHVDKLPDTPSIDEVIGSDWPAVLAGGLSALPHSRLVRLLQHPNLLLDLQARVLADGGPAWTLPDPADSVIQQQREAGWLRIRRSIDEEQWQALASSIDLNSASTSESHSAPIIEPDSVSPGSSSASRPPTRRSLFHPLVLILTTAVVALSALLIWQSRTERADSEAWGWNRPEVLAQPASRRQYLERLADSAGDWFNRRPVTRRSLADRLLQFRRGCATLLLKEHKPLPEEDRRWLAEACRRWAAALDEQLEQLEQGEDVLEVRDAIDAQVNRIIAALRAQAKE